MLIVYKTRTFDKPEIKKFSSYHEMAEYLGYLCIEYDCVMDELTEAPDIMEFPEFSYIASSKCSETSS